MSSLSDRKWRPSPPAHTHNVPQSQPPSEPWVLGRVLPLTVTSDKTPVLALLRASVLLHKTHLCKQGLGSKFH